MLVLSLIAYAVVGAIAGILAGMLGIGGGIVTVPCLFLIFYLVGYPQPHQMHMAIATSLAAMVFNTLGSLWAHSKKNNVLWCEFRKMALGLIIGSILGSLTAAMISGVFLQLFFGIFLLALAIHFYRTADPYLGEYHSPSHLLFGVYSFGIGALSNILGIGGGTLSVSLLMAHKMSDRKAIGTSAAVSFLVTTLGAISYTVIGWDQSSIPDCIGYVCVPAFLVVGAVSFACVPYGVKLVHRLPPKKIRQIFAVVLALTGISLIM